MPLLVYKVIHLVGLILVFQGLGASLFSRRMHATPDTDPESTTAKIPGNAPKSKAPTLLHGVGLFLLLLGGFGMLARLEIGFPFPLWTWVKLTIWLVLGAAPAIVKRQPGSARLWWVLVFVLGTVAAYMGLYKPF